MKKIFLFGLILAIVAGKVNAQTDSKGVLNGDSTYSIVEQMPEFPGGQDGLNKFLNENLHYPKLAMEQGIQGKVWLGFEVDSSGNVTNVEVLRGIGGGCDEEAKRVIELMPQWSPGKQNGKNVRVKFRFPIVFSLGYGTDLQTSYWVVDDVTHQSTGASWVNGTAVFNCDGASFQVLLKTIPTKSKTYKVRDNETFAYDGKMNEASVAYLENNFNDYYGSVKSNKGKISVTVTTSSITIVVENVTICTSDNSKCKKIRGKIVIAK